MAAPLAGGMATMQTSDDDISDEEMVARAQRDPRHFAPLYRRSRAGGGHHEPDLHPGAG